MAQVQTNQNGHWLGHCVGVCSVNIGPVISLHTRAFISVGETSRSWIAGSKGMCISSFKRNCQIAVQKRLQQFTFLLAMLECSPPLTSLSPAHTAQQQWERISHWAGKYSEIDKYSVSQLEASAVEKSERSCGFKEGLWQANLKLPILHAQGRMSTSCLAFPHANPHQLQFRPCPFFLGRGDNFIAADVPILEICGAV